MLLAAFLAVSLVQGDSARPLRRFRWSEPAPADSAALATAYLDSAARETVRLARERLDVVDRSVLGYRALAKEQISVGIRALGRDRMLYRREMAARIDWRRDGLRQIDVVGAREAIPIAIPGVQIPEDMRQDVRDLAFNPADNQLQIGLSDSSFVRHPLAPGAEADYRYASGDTTVIEFPDGRTVHLLEIRVIPRRDEFRLLRGSLWIDQDSHAVVRVVFRPARPFNLEEDLKDVTDNTGEDVNGHIPGILKPITAEIRVVTIEYGLWRYGWWMPRLMLFDGVASAGSFLHLPLRYERTYSEYDVWAIGDTTPWKPVARPAVATAADSGADTLRARRRRVRTLCTDEQLAADSARADSVADALHVGRRRGRCNTMIVSVPADTMALLTSPALPPSIFAQDDHLVTQSDLAALEAQLNNVPPVPWKLHAPSWALGLSGSGLVRYDRVEALSVAGRSTFDLGRVSVDATGRIGIGDRIPLGELGVTHDALNTTTRLAAYRRLAVANPDTKALGFGSSVSAFFLGRDDGEYFRTLGVELSQTPAATLPQYATWRVYAEHQRVALKTTDVSLEHLLDSTHVFHPNIIADSADEVGGSLGLHGTRGLNPSGVRWNGDVTMDAAVGTFAFARVSSTQRVTTPLPFGLTWGLEASAGTSGGAVPVQSLFYLGGPATLRGFDGGVTAGESYWRGRAELATAFPAARVVAFTDLGWAGPRSAFALHDPFWSVGLGASFLDGLLRIDVARGVRRGDGTRADLYVGGTL